MRKITYLITNTIQDQVELLRLIQSNFIMDRIRGASRGINW